MLSVRKRKLELEEIEIKKRKLDYVTETTALKEEYESVLQKEQTILDARNRFRHYFKQSPWKNLDVAEKYKLSAFTVNNNGTHPRVGVLVESDKCKCVCYLRGYLKPLFVKIHANSDLLKKDGFIVTPCGGLDIVHIETEKPFAEFNTNGMTTFNGNSFAKIENFKFYTKTQQDYGEETTTYTQDDVDIVSNITMQEIKGKIKISECSRLEDLEEGIELIVKGIKQIVYRQKVRYLLEFDST